MMERIERGIEWLHRVYGAILDWALVASQVGDRDRARDRSSRASASLPLVGTEFVPEGDQGFISLRLNTPVGSSLEYTDSKVRQVEEALKAFPEIALAMTTVGTEEGRNYARINLKLTDRARARALAEGRSRARSARRCSRSPGIELALGFNRPIWVNLLGPDPETLSTIMRRVPGARRARCPASPTSRTRTRPRNPALSIRLNNDAAADLGITVQQVGSTLRPLLAGDTVSYWLAPDGKNYEVNVQLPKDRPAPRVRPRQPLDLDEQARARRRAAHGAAAPGRRDRRDDEPADHQAPGAAAPRRALRERRGAAVRRRRQGRAEDHRRDEAELPPGYRFDVGGQQKDMQESFQAAVAALGLAVIFIYLILASQFGSFVQPVAIMAIAAVLADRRVPRAAVHRHDAQHLLDHRRHHADGAGDEERDPARRLRQPRAARRRVASTPRWPKRARCGCGRS